MSDVLRPLPHSYGRRPRVRLSDFSAVTAPIDDPKYRLGGNQVAGWTSKTALTVGLRWALVFDQPLAVVQVKNGCRGRGLE